MTSFIYSTTIIHEIGATAGVGVLRVLHGWRVTDGHRLDTLLDAGFAVLADPEINFVENISKA